MSLSTKNRAYLRSLANTISPSLILGKGEADMKFLEAADHALEAHELIKIKVLPSASKSPDEFLEELCLLLKAEPVNRLGRILTIYRPNEKKKQKIVLPR